MNETLLRVGFILLAVRLLAPAPDASDPPDMHAFYHAWLQPPWWLVALPFGLVLLLPWVFAALAVGWAWRNKE